MPDSNSVLHNFSNIHCIYTQYTLPIILIEATASALVPQETHSLEQWRLVDVLYHVNYHIIHINFSKLSRYSSL